MVQRLQPNREYDPFARIYNRHWGEDYRADAGPIVERLLLSRVPRGSSILDVCCGTGQFTEFIRKHGYHIEGVDASSEMIRYARLNAPSVDFTVSDVRDFDLGRRFDAAYSVYESLNHVPDTAGLRLAFTCIRRHLKPGAPFLFDLNREEAYSLYWNNRDSIVDPESVCALSSEYDEDSKTARCDITAFERSRSSPELWVRTDFTVHQKCHEIHEACEALYDAGLHNVVLYDARDAGMAGDMGFARTFFVAFA